MTTCPPSPFPWKGATAVRGLIGRSVLMAAPPWGGPAEAP
jgi:hypothetical protein